MASMNVRSGDLVEIKVGSADVRGKQGRVIAVNPDKKTVVVENLNLVTKHKKPRSAQDQGGKIQFPRPISVSNVMVVCPKCGKATRVGHVLAENGKYVRQCKKCSAVIDTKAVKKAEKEVKTTKTRTKKTAEKADKE